MKNVNIYDFSVAYQLHQSTKIYTLAEALYDIHLFISEVYRDLKSIFWSIKVLFLFPVTLTYGLDVCRQDAGITSVTLTNDAVTSMEQLFAMTSAVWNQIL